MYGSEQEHQQQHSVEQKKTLTHSSSLKAKHGIVVLMLFVRQSHSGDACNDKNADRERDAIVHILYTQFLLLLLLIFII